MPATIVQSNAGGFNGTTGNATLPSGTTAGNTLLLIVGVGPTGTNPSPNPPTGFTPASGEGPTPTSNKVEFFRKSNVSAGETSWAIGSSVTNLICWSVLEVEGLDLSTPKDVTPASFSTASAATSVSTGTAPQSSTYDAFVVAAHHALNATNSTVPTWSGQTGGFVEETDAGIAAGATASGLAVSTLSSQSLGAFSSTATCSVTSNLGASVVVYTCAGAKRASDVVQFTGFEFGTVAGLTTAGIASTLLFDSQGGSPAIVSTGPRTGSYCLELAAAAAAEYVQWSSALGTSSQFGVLRFCFMFVGSLPGADVAVASMAGASGTGTQNCLLSYRSASQKLGLLLTNAVPTAGTEQFSASALVADTWYAIDIRYDTTGTTTATGDWQVDGVDQTQATVSGTSVGVVAVTLGWVGSGTATVRYDDVVYSKTPGHYPLGDMRVLPLTVDPAGTVTVSGSTANFGVMTANGTIGAWDATAARNAVDDIPPTIGAAADGVVAVTASATDYVEFPMQTYDAAANGVAIRAVKAYFPLWAASATAATIRLLAFDGTTTYTLLAENDPNADNSTTVPVWVAKVIRTSAAVRPDWTQAKLDALVLRMGSNDATPDIGVHAVLCEVAVRAGEARPVLGEAGDVQAASRVDPDSGAVLSATLTAPAGRGATLLWTGPGGAGSQPVAAGGTWTQPFADTVDSTSLVAVGMVSDPEDANRE